MASSMTIGECIPPAYVRRSLERAQCAEIATLCVRSQTPTLASAQHRAPRSTVTTARTTRPSNRIRGIPDATVARLPIYLRALSTLADRGIETASSEELAAAAGVNSAKLRKDLSYLGSYGTRGVGYQVEYLVYQISLELGLTQDWAVAIIGVGNLGHALANYGGFASRGFRVVALLDADQARVGEEVAGLRIRHIDDLEEIVRQDYVDIGVVATPAGSAQEVCDRLVAAGVTSILNFAPAVLVVPDSVEVRKVDLSIELQILAFHEQRKATGGPLAAALTAVSGRAAQPDAPKPALAGETEYPQAVEA